MPEDFVSDMCDIIMAIAKLKPKMLRNLEFRYVFKLVVKLLSSKYASVSLMVAIVVVPDNMAHLT
jgi:hypothetical protein